MHYNEIEREYEEISGKDDKTARNCLVFTLNCIVMQMNKDVCEKGYWPASGIVSPLIECFKSLHMNAHTVKLYFKRYFTTDPRLDRKDNLCDKNGYYLGAAYFYFIFKLFGGPRGAWWHNVEKVGPNSPAHVVL